MLIYAMSVSVDGYIADRDGNIDWGEPSDELFAFHLERMHDWVPTCAAAGCTRRCCPGKPILRCATARCGADFADVWSSLPKIVFSRTLTSVQGNARLATASVAEEVGAAVGASDVDVEIGGATLAEAAIQLGLVDEFRIFRVPIVLGGGTPYLPAVASRIRLDLIEARTFDSRVVYEHYRRTTSNAS